MTKSSRSDFGNVLLRQWLLKVGPVRRRRLLTKFRADLVRRGLSRLAWQEGLVQLSSPPFVRLIRYATTKTTERNDLMKDLRIKIKAAQLQKDSNNNDKNNNDLSNEKHIKNERRDLDQRPNHTAYPECSTSRNSSMPPNLAKVLKPGDSERRRSSGSHKTKDSDRPRKKIKHRVSKEGENPNGVNWRLTKIDMENPLKSPGLRFQQLRQIDRQKKKDRLYAKFLEIFGEDIDPPEQKSKSKHRAKETYKEQVSETAIRCKDMEGDNEDRKVDDEDTAERRSPTFETHRWKRRRESHQGVKKRKKHRTVETHDTLRDSISSDNAFTEQGGACFSQASVEETNSLGNNDSVANWTPTVDSVAGDHVTLDQQNLAVEESDTDTRSTIFVVHNTAETDKAADSSLGNECEGEKLTEELLGDLKLEMESDRESCDTVHISQSSVETVPVTRQQSVIVKLDKSCIESEEASFVMLDLKSTELDIPNQETDFTEVAETRNSTESGARTPTIKAAADNSKSQKPDSPETEISSCENLKKEPIDQPDPTVSPSTISPITDQESLNIDTNYFPDILENDPNPTSTTDTETNGPIKSGTFCVSDRLLGALDNIYLTLCYRRRVQERVQTASKLAIKQNRQEEVSKAQQELESKLIIFRNEIRYLFSRLDTWDRVLRFIAQGLDHRTPAGITRFSVAEVETAMLDAELKPPLNISAKESEVPKLHLVNRVLCTIDLTEDDRDEDRAEDLCDSSTDPPRSQNHSSTGKRSEPDTEADGSWARDLNANEIQLPLPSIAEVKTISPQQFDTFGDEADLSSGKSDDPCYLCSRASVVACARCMKAAYCSKPCQLAHWKQSHHATCVLWKPPIFLAKGE